MPDGPVGADQANAGRGGRERDCLPGKEGWVLKGEAKQMEGMVLETAWAFGHWGESWA